MDKDTNILDAIDEVLDRNKDYIIQQASAFSGSDLTVYLSAVRDATKIAISGMIDILYSSKADQTKPVLTLLKSENREETQE